VKSFKDLRFSGDFLTKNDKIAILEFINKNKDCFAKKRLKRVIYHHDTRLTITNAMVEEHLKLGAVTPFSLIRCMRILDRTALRNRWSKVKLLVTNIISLCIKFKTN
jgi:hypothetical protein